MGRGIPISVFMQTTGWRTLGASRKRRSYKVELQARFAEWKIIDKKADYIIAPRASGEIASGGFRKAICLSPEMARV